MSRKQQNTFIIFGFVLMAIFAPFFAALTAMAVLQMFLSYLWVKFIAGHWRTIAVAYFAAFYVLLGITAIAWLVSNVTSIFR